MAGVADFGSLKSVNVQTGQIVVIPLFIHSELTVLGEMWGPLIIRATRQNDKEFVLETLQEKIHKWQVGVAQRGGANYHSMFAAAMTEGMIFSISPDPNGIDEPFFYALFFTIKKGVDPRILEARRKKIDEWKAGAAHII